MTIYAVTGRPRTGTSMMMRALDRASSIPTYYDSELDQDVASLAPDLENYHPNPNGYFLPPYTHRVGDKDEMLVKAQLMSDEWQVAPPGDYLVVRMVRDETARQASWLRSFDRAETEAWFSRYDENETYLMSRPDFHVITVAYEEMLEDPRREFSRIASHGWPIDWIVAANTIDPNLYRNKVTDDGSI